MSHDDFEREPIPGLPAKLPKGEHIVWQGKPDKKTFLRHVLHNRLIAIYFGALIAWRIGSGIYDGSGFSEIMISAVWALVLGGIVIALGWWFARAVERTTIYTITNKRVVMRFGVALPITFNYPFSQIVAADVRHLTNGTGTIALSLAEHTKISWPVLWPHARPWKLAKPQPALRAVANVDSVAEILADHLTELHGRQVDKSSDTAPMPSSRRTRSARSIGNMQAEVA